MRPADVLSRIITPALSMMPSRMDTPKARVMLLAIGLQESRFIHRRQIKGPARGFWQFERGGVAGVLRHHASRVYACQLCAQLGVPFTPDDVYLALEMDDILAAGIARLLLWTDPYPLPENDDAGAAWQLYLRTWRPGKPHAHTWPELHRQAVEAVADWRPAA